MTCLLCPLKLASPCPGCVYLKSPRQPPPNISDELRNDFCQRCSLPHAADQASLHFIDHIFRPSTQASSRKRTLNKATDTFANVSKRLKTTKAEVEGQPDAVVRLVRFMKLARLLLRCEFSNKIFDVNEVIFRVWMVTHINGIVGIDNFRSNENKLMSILNIHTISILHIRHVLWVTSRQQGKTLLFARFCACLLMLSPINADLMDMYSTTLRKSSDMLKWTRRYIKECMDNRRIVVELENLGMQVPKLTTDNKKELGVRACVAPHGVNVMYALSCDVENNRGNNSMFIGVDEGSWVGMDLITVMIAPLLAAPHRTMTILTTPPEADNKFNLFIDKIIEDGRKSAITYINHVHKCSRCISSGAARCVHRLWLTPDHKSILGTQIILRSMPDEEREKLEREFYGEVKPGAHPYFNESVLRRCLFDTPEIDVLAAPARVNILIYVDLPSHDNSWGGIAAVTHSIGGMTVVLGSCEFPAEESAAVEIETIVRLFTDAVFKHPSIRMIDKRRFRLIPAPEANNNGILARTMMNNFKAFAQDMGIEMFMPWSHRYVSKEIIEDCGPLASESNKKIGCIALHKTMIKSQLVFVKNMVTVAPPHLPKARAQTHQESKKTIYEQCKALRNDKRGRLSGKSGGKRDDQVIALIEGSMWLDRMVELIAKAYSPGW